MRGDSLRDFYAKTFAVLGLGLLAGAGAIVDYWPLGSTVPEAAAARLPMPAIARLNQNLDQRIPAPAFSRDVFVRGTIHAKNVGSARFLEPAAVVAAKLEPVAPSAPVPNLSVTVVDTLASTLSPVEFVEQTTVVYAAPAQSATQQAPGFIGGALRKTKDSIVRTGAATGSTIADAFKGVAGVFKKISPF